MTSISNFDVQEDQIISILKKPLPKIIQYGILGISLLFIILFIICFNINIENQIQAKVHLYNDNKYDESYEPLILTLKSNQKIYLGQDIFVKSDDNDKIFLGKVINYEFREETNSLSIYVLLEQKAGFSENEDVTIQIKFNIGKFLFSSPGSTHEKN
jgi:hypothetical protein